MKLLKHRQQSDHLKQHQWHGGVHRSKVSNFASERGRDHEASVHRHGGGCTCDFCTGLGAASPCRTPQRERLRSDGHHETHRLRDACPSSTSRGPVCEESIGWHFRRPAEPARALNITGRQSKPDESDACRREGNVREYNAVRYRAERRAARRAKLAGRGRRCFAQEPWVPVIGRLSRVFEIAALPRYRNLRIAGGSHAGTAASARHGTRRARQWNLDRPRTVDPAHPMRPLAGMLNQRIHGRFSGVVSLARSSVPLRDLSLLPDGSFSGTTQAGVVGSTYARAYKVAGKFTGETVHLTLENDICPARHGVATRHGGGH